MVKSYLRGIKKININAVTIIPELYIESSERQSVKAYDKLIHWVDKTLDYNIPLNVIKTRNENTSNT